MGGEICSKNEFNPPVLQLGIGEWSKQGINSCLDGNSSSDIHKRMVYIQSCFKNTSSIGIILFQTCWYRGRSIS